MFFKRVYTESLAHYSYIIGDGKELIVIDPQPEVDLYLDISLKNDMPITTILETHRNEDFISGSKALSDLCNAKIYIAAEHDLDYHYGERVVDGQVFKLDNIFIKALHTPGHTLGHMSYVLYYNNHPYIVFVGDVLFYGEIGRFDFYGKDKLDKMASLLYDSIFNKLLPLGDEVIMCPAHTAGSACGESLEDRPYSTLGYERKYNKKLQYDSKEEFVKENKIMLFKPPYFNYMEKVNLTGTKPKNHNLKVNFKHANDINSDNIILDVRDQNAYNKAHIVNSIWIKQKQIVNFISWVIDHESDITIVSDSYNRKEVIKDLNRIGYDNISFLANGITAWYKTNNPVDKIETILPKEYNMVKDNYFIVDVRKDSEADIDYGEKGIFIPIESIRDDYIKLIDKENILVVCPGGIRSNTVVSYLKSKGIKSKLLIGGLDAVL